MFCFESYKHQVGMLVHEHLVSLLAREALLAINEIPNILQCTLPPHSIYQTLLFDFQSRVRLAMVLRLGWGLDTRLLSGFV